MRMCMYMGIYTHLSRGKYRTTHQRISYRMRYLLSSMSQAISIRLEALRPFPLPTLQDMYTNTNNKSD